MMQEPTHRNRAHGCWKRKTGVEKKLIIGISVLSAIAILFALLFFLKRSCDTDEEECRSKFCVKAASELLDFVDLKEDPCQHFYKYVCGAYYKHAVKKDSPSPFVSINNEFENELKSVIVDPIRKSDTNGHVLVKQFYHECMNQTKIDLDNNKAFMRVINQMGGWPLLNGSDWKPTNFDHWTDWYLKSTALGLPVFGFFTFAGVDYQENQTILQVSDSQTDWKIFVGKDKYNTVMKEVFQALGGKDFREEENEKVFKFAKQIEKMQVITDDKEKVGTMQDLIDACPSVPWLKLLNSYAVNGKRFDNSTKVSFGDITGYCQSLKKLIESTDARTIVNYFIWNIIHQSHNYLGRNVRNAYDDMRFYNPPRYEICYEETDKRFKYVKETIYIRKKTPKIVRDQLNEMINIMKEVFIEHVKECDWMDASTKKTALIKTEMIGTLIGGADEMYEESFNKYLGIDGFKFESENMFDMDRQKRIKENEHLFNTFIGPKEDDWPGFFEHAVKLNAFFLQIVNVMVLPAPILSSIFYDYRVPAFMNYGSIGRIIGHEIMHGFEKSGREILREDGNLEDWWTNATADAYDKKVQCVIDEYEQVRFRYKLNGTLTLDENISDFVGIDIAYEAYLRYIKKHGVEQKLPGIPLTPEQIFWVQTGTFLCFRKLDDDATDYEEEDEHAIPAFRVQAGARHSKYFAKDFNCPVGTRMNPKDKCRIM